MASPLKILWVATKPPWPPIDGGRLVMATTIEALLALGHRITVVAPLVGREPTPPSHAGLDVRWVEAPRPSYAKAALRSFVLGGPWTVTRHRAPAVRAAVRRILVERDFDLLWVEQLQAVASLPSSPGLPVMLRMQNVESDLWRQTSRIVPVWQRPLFLLEAGRLARTERRTMTGIQGVVALTQDDALRLRSLSSRARIDHVAVPFPRSLPSNHRSLRGSPALSLFDGGWLPNRDGANWFLREIWPRLDRGAAELHVFGDRPRRGPAIHNHPTPTDSVVVFPSDGALVVPLRAGSGIRMKILESWARRSPVVATSRAAAGLEARDGRELLIADGIEAFSSAIQQLKSRDSRHELARAATRFLEKEHDPKRQGHRLVELVARL